MAKTKKPKKQYQRGKVIAGAHLPIPAKIKDTKETKALMALTALEGGFYNKAMGLDLVMFLSDCRHIAKDDMETCAKLLPAFRALNSIVDRNHRTGKWGVTGDERNVLKKVVPEMVEYYKKATAGQAIEAGTISNAKYVLAVSRINAANCTETS